MSIKSLNPYLMFDGTAEKAIKLYERALGAKCEGVMRYGDVPGDAPCPGEVKDRILHATVHVGPSVIMVSDGMPGTPVAKESNTEVCLHFDDVESMAKAFDALAAGGKVTSPLQDMFWGARFGTLTDAFGIRWMFNCDLQKA
ncbi:glyoxalase/bleomycin resistance/extradiol dioxygenase family protein [Sorangium sp. So ce1036]|uniref:VOC family protein n=1 Tax=Sorangium sp. So ce1036 TaxID=3133328 RepID=UPI003EFC0D12